MFVKHPRKDPLIIKYFPISARIAEESATLADKFASRIEWMRLEGISGDLPESTRPRREAKPPRPGTVIYFSMMP
jgi:hypothetical protein